jgi:hypothetical protein
VTRSLWATVMTTAVFVAIGLGIALAVGAPDPGAFERAAAGAFGVLGLAAGLITLSAAVEAGLPPRPRVGRSGDEPVDAGAAALADLERALRFGASAAGDFHAYVRPRLVPLARARLARHGVSLSDRDGAAALLGADGYALVDPNAAPPEDRFEPGVPLDQLRLLVDRLETLSDGR